MRRMVVLLAALLAAMLVAAGTLPWGIPAETLISGTAERADGSILAAENRDIVSRIYTLQNQRPSELYQEFRLHNGKETGIVRVAVDGADVYFLRVSESGTDWELVRLENSEAVSVHQGIFEDELTVTGLKAHGGTVWITALNKNKAILVYEYTEQSGAGLKLLCPAWWMWDTATAEFDGQRIRVTTEQGDHCYISPTGEKTYTDAAAEAPVPAIRAEGTAWLLCKQSVFLVAFIFWLIIAVSAWITVLLVKRADQLATRLTAMGAEVLFLSLLAMVGLVFFQTLRPLGLPAALHGAAVAAIIAVIVWLTGVLALRILSRRMTRQMAELARQMEDVAAGRISVQEVSSGRDELNRMSRAMQELCMSLSIRNYELDSVIRSYRRFVPQKLTELLDRANLAEVDQGDSRRIVGNVGLFSVGNRAEARAMLQDDDFVKFINGSFGIFQKCIQENRGCMISSGLQLSNMNTLFTESPADGVRAGLDFLGQAQKKTADSIPQPQPFLLLHRAPLLYGVAGQADRLYTYMSSSELEFLDSFSQQFYEAGTRIVTTEAYWKQLSDSGFNGRYIGFVSDGDKNAYKLYEILDAYPELECRFRLQYDQRFQEAINLFYHNDFFLARNLFSTLLRVCPEDGIARWYMFACERFFNQEGDYEPDYRLFGTGEK